MKYNLNHLFTNNLTRNINLQFKQLKFKSLRK